MFDRDQFHLLERARRQRVEVSHQPPVKVPLHVLAQSDPSLQALMSDGNPAGRAVRERYENHQQHVAESVWVRPVGGVTEAPDPAEPWLTVEPLTCSGTKTKEAELCDGCANFYVMLVQRHRLERHIAAYKAHKTRAVNEDGDAPQARFMPQLNNYFVRSDGRGPLPDGRGDGHEFGIFRVVQRRPVQLADDDGDSAMSTSPDEHAVRMTLYTRAPPPDSEEQQPIVFANYYEREDPYDATLYAVRSLPLLRGCLPHMAATLLAQADAFDQLCSGHWDESVHEFLGLMRAVGGCATAWAACNRLHWRTRSGGRHPQLYSDKCETRVVAKGLGCAKTCAACTKLYKVVEKDMLVLTEMTRQYAKQSSMSAIMTKYVYRRTPSIAQFGRYVPGLAGVAAHPLIYDAPLVAPLPIHFHPLVPSGPLLRNDARTRQHSSQHRSQQPAFRAQYDSSSRRNKRKPSHAFGDRVLRYLEAEFERNSHGYPQGQRLAALMHNTSLREDQIKSWFHRRRARARTNSSGSSHKKART